MSSSQKYHVRATKKGRLPVAIAKRKHKKVVEITRCSGDLAALLKDLQRVLGTGGTVRAESGSVELQGERHLSRVCAWLVQSGCVKGLSKESREASLSALLRGKGKRAAPTAAKERALAALRKLRAGNSGRGATKSVGDDAPVVTRRERDPRKPRHVARNEDGTRKAVREVKLCPNVHCNWFYCGGAPCFVDIVAAQRRSGAVDDMSDIWIDAALGDSSGGRQRGAVSGVSSAAVNAWGAGAALSRPSVRHSIDKGLDLLGMVAAASRFAKVYDRTQRVGEKKKAALAERAKARDVQRKAERAAAEAAAARQARADRDWAYSHPGQAGRVVVRGVGAPPPQHHRSRAGGGRKKRGRRKPALNVGWGGDDMDDFNGAYEEYYEDEEEEENYGADAAAAVPSVQEQRAQAAAARQKDDRRPAWMRVSEARAGSNWLAAKARGRDSVERTSSAGNERGAAARTQSVASSTTATARGASLQLHTMGDDEVYALAVDRGVASRVDDTIDAVLGVDAVLFNWRGFLARLPQFSIMGSAGGPGEAAAEGAALQLELGIALDRVVRDDGDEEDEQGGVGMEEWRSDGPPPGFATPAGSGAGDETASGNGYRDEEAALEESATTLVLMGFSEEATWDALARCGGDLETALSLLLAEDGGGCDGGADGDDEPFERSSEEAMCAVAADSVPHAWLGTELPPYVCVALQRSGSTRWFVECRDGDAAVAPGSLTCFGGKRERGERPLACALRELREELGWSPDRSELISSLPYSVCRLLVDGQLVAWFYSASAPNVSTSTSRGTLLHYEAGRSGTFVSLSEPSLSPWHHAVLCAMVRGESTAHYRSRNASEANETSALLARRAEFHGERITRRSGPEDDEASGSDDDDSVGLLGGGASAAVSRTSGGLSAATSTAPSLETQSKIVKTNSEHRDDLSLLERVLETRPDADAELAEYICSTVRAVLFESLTAGDAALAEASAADMMLQLLSDGATPRSGGGGGGLSAEVDALLAPLLRERGAAAAAKAEAEAAAVAPPFTREPEHSEPSLAITSLLNMGFERAVAEEALLRYDGSAPRAIEWLLSNS